MNKSTIRKIYQQKRVDLTRDQIQEKSLAIANNFISNLLPNITDFENKKLAFYVSANNEADPSFIIKHCQKLGNLISLPKIKSDSLVLGFKEHKINDMLISNKNYPKLLEPDESKKNIIPDVIFVPLVAFDKNCHRIGMGGGFYDTTIEFFRRNYPKKIFIGLGYDLQNYEEIETEKLDQSLDFIVSESILMPCKQ